MKTIILNKPGELQFIRRPIPDVVGEGEVIVRIRRIGICGTDYHAYRGKQPFFSYPRVLGHELGAEVVAIGGSQATTTVKIGDRVSIEPYLNCGKCQPCRNGKGNCCENINVLGVHIDGGMAEYLKLPLNKVHVSDKLEYEQLALVETLAIGRHAVNRAGIKENDKVVIIGAGPIGLAVAQFCRLAGAEICMVDMNPERLKFAATINVLDKSVLVNSPLTEGEIRGQMEGDLPDVVIDATGNVTSMTNCFNITSHGGKVVFIGLFMGDVTFNDPNFHKRELTLLSSRNAQPEDFSQIIKLIEQKKIDTTPWISRRISFDHLPTTFSELLQANAGVVKAMIEL